jgi:hypothetical protein
MSNIGSTGPLEVQKKDRRLLLTSLGLLALVGMVCAHCVPEAVAQQMDSVSSLHNHQHQAQCRRNIDQLARACANYAADHGRSPSHCSQLVPSYLSQLPKCPQSNSSSYAMRHRSLSGTEVCLPECLAGHSTSTVPVTAYRPSH